MVGRVPLVRDVRVRFWREVRAGRAVMPASVAAGVSHETGRRWFAEAGGVIGNAPRELGKRYLSVEEREEISRGLAGEGSFREIALRLGRPVSTVSREVGRNGGRDRYRAHRANAAARERAKRPKTAKLAETGPDTELRDYVQAGLRRRWSPEQISARLVTECPDRPEMRVSHETIYQSLYVQSRGALRRDLTRYLRTGRVLRKPHRQAEARRQRIPNLVEISRAPGRGRGPGRARALGRRSDPGRRKQVRDRHPGRAQQPVVPAAAPARQPRRRRRPRRHDRRHLRPCPAS